MVAVSQKSFPSGMFPNQLRDTQLLFYLNIPVQGTSIPFHPTIPFPLDTKIPKTSDEGERLNPNLSFVPVENLLPPFVNQLFRDAIKRNTSSLESAGNDKCTVT